MLLLVFFTSSLSSQELSSDDNKYPEGGTKSVVYWTNYNLKYYIHNYGGGLTDNQCQTAIQNAFNKWAQYTNFTFTRTYYLSQADIELKWDADYFSATPNKLAYSSLGKMNNRTPPAFIYFNNNQTFTMTSSGYNLQTVTLREIGRVLGVDYIPNSSAVMYSGYYYSLDLTGYDLFEFYKHYAFPGTLTGPRLVSSSGEYEITNFPSGLTTSWKLSDNYYNSGYNLLVQNTPSIGYCVIARDSSHDMTNATLTATIKKDNITVDSLKLDHIYAYAGFKGSYTSGNLSGNIDYTLYFNIKANTVTTITSANFYGATVTYSSSGATPSYWGFNPNNGVLNFNTLNTSTPVIINVHDVCGNNYTLYAYASSYYSINVSNGEGGITVTLVEDGDASKDFTLDEPWTIEVINAATGQVMATQSSTSRSETISTAGWPKGIYVVKVTIGKEELTEKVMIK